MTIKNRDILKKLAEGLLTLKPEQFDMDNWANECGTVCCAIGWMPKLCPEVKELGFELRTEDDGIPCVYFDGKESYRAVERFFDLSHSQATFLFSSSSYFDPTPEIVSARILRFLEDYK